METTATETTADPASLPPVHFLTDYNSDAWQKQWKEDIVPGFKEATGVDIELEFASYAGTSSGRLGQLIQAGNPPDLFSSIFEWAADLWAGDQLTPVNGVYEQIRSNVGETIVDPFTDDNDNAYLVTHGYYAAPVLYRTDVYDQLGLSEPDTFAQLKANAKKIDEADMDIRGMAVPGDKAGIMGETVFSLMYRQMGNRMIGWKSEDREEETVTFPKEDAIWLLNYFKDMAQYSPDPTSVTVVATLKEWGAGRYAQQIHLNMWPAGVAALINPEVAKNTAITALPLGPDTDLSETTQSPPDPDGHLIIKNGENTPGARELLKYMYGRNPQATAGLYDTSPTRFMPNFEGVLESDTFQNVQHFKDYPGHLEGMQWIQNTFVPKYYGNSMEQIPQTGPNMYFERFNVAGKMMHNVLGAGMDPEKAYNQAKQTAEKRLQEGKDRFS